MTDLGPDVRLYSAAGARKPFPTFAIASVDWELSDRGYYSKCGIEIKADFDGALNVDNGDRVDIYVDGTLRYRGYIRTLQAQLDTSERLVITACGLMEQLNGILVPGRYVSAGSTDVSAFATWLYDNYISERLAPAVGLTSDIQTVGVAFEPLKLDCNRDNARKLMDTLADLAGSALVWGFDTDGSGQDRFFVRPKPEGVAHKFQIGGRVRSYDYPRDSTSVVNTIHLTGSAADYPNQLANSSLEEPIVCDAEHADLLVGGSLEEELLWGLLNAEYTTSYPCQGKRSVVVYTNGGYLYQGGIPIEVGSDYTLEFWHFAKVGASFHVEIIPDVGDTIRFPDVGSYTSLAAGTNGPFTFQVCQFTGPAGASNITIKIIFTSVSCPLEEGLFVDEISLRRDNSIAQTGWFLDRRSPSNDISVDWSNTDSYHGGLAARVTGTLSGGESVRIHQPVHHALDVQAKHYYQLAFWAKSKVGEVEVTPLIVANNTDGTYTTYHGDGAQTIGVDWTRVVFSDSKYCPVVYSDELYEESVLVGVELTADSADGSGNVDLLLDAFYWSELPGSVFTESPYCPDYVESDRFEWDLSTDDAFIQSSGLSDAVKHSIATLGRHEASVSVDTINSLEMAQEWAKAYFGLHAVDEIGHRIEIVGCHEPVAPDGKLQLLGSSIEPGFPVKVTYKMVGNRLDMSAELNTERPSFDLLLSSILKQATVIYRNT